MKKSYEVYKKHLQEKKPITINYGDGIKCYATWDEEIGHYRDETGYWSIILLLEIARGEVENTILEIGE